MDELEPDDVWLEVSCSSGNRCHVRLIACLAKEDGEKGIMDCSFEQLPIEADFEEVKKVVMELTGVPAERVHSHYERDPLRRIRKLKSLIAHGTFTDPLDN